MQPNSASFLSAQYWLYWATGEHDCFLRLDGDFAAFPFGEHTNDLLVSSVLNHFQDKKCIMHAESILYAQYSGKIGLAVAQRGTNPMAP
jgi:hypothetical protein